VATRRVRRAVLALAILAAPVTMAVATPASADSYHPRLSTGGCITGIAVVVDGTPRCRVIGGEPPFRIVQYSWD
jgi:hypothetical protein